MTGSSDQIHIVIISGSVRLGNYTNMASALVLDELKKHPKVSTEVIDPATLNLPPPGTDPQSKDAKQLQQKVGQATGIILATPEYYGSFSSVMKHVIESLGHPSPLAGKPVALLGVAGGTIGAVKSLEHLRSVVSHVGGIVLPLPISSRMSGRSSTTRVDAWTLTPSDSFVASEQTCSPTSSTMSAPE